MPAERGKEGGRVSPAALPNRTFNKSKDSNVSLDSIHMIKLLAYSFLHAKLFLDIYNQEIRQII